MDANVSPKRAWKEVVRVTAVRLGRLLAFPQFFKPRCRQLDLSFPGSDPFMSGLGSKPNDFASTFSGSHVSFPLPIPWAKSRAANHLPSCSDLGLLRTPCNSELQASPTALTGRVASTGATELPVGTEGSCLPPLLSQTAASGSPWLRCHSLQPRSLSYLSLERPDWGRSENPQRGLAREDSLASVSSLGTGWREDAGLFLQPHWSCCCWQRGWGSGAGLSASPPLSGVSGSHGYPVKQYFKQARSTGT